MLNGTSYESVHPSPQDEWINTILENEVIPRLQGSSPGSFQMIASPAVFDAIGRLRVISPGAAGGKSEPPTDADARDSKFLSWVDQEWVGALLEVKDRSLDDRQIRMLAAQSCGAPGINSFRKALQRAVLFPAHVVRAPFKVP